MEAAAKQTSKRIVVLRNVPGALVLNPERYEIAPWEQVCHRKGLTFVDHEPFRELSRWKHADRKRPFVLRSRDFEILESSKTLDLALSKAAGSQA